MPRQPCPIRGCEGLRGWDDEIMCGRHLAMIPTDLARECEEFVEATWSAPFDGAALSRLHQECIDAVQEIDG